MTEQPSSAPPPSRGLEPASRPAIPAAAPRPPAAPLSAPLASRPAIQVKPSTGPLPAAPPKPRLRVPVIAAGPVAHAAAHSGSAAQLVLWAQQLGKAAHYVHVDDQILWGMFGLETNFGQYIDTSSAGAMGLMQFIPGTAAAYHYPMTNYPSEGQSQQQMTAAALYLRDLYNSHGHSYNSAILAYSGGGYDEGTVIRKANTRKQADYGPTHPTPPPRKVYYANPLGSARVSAERIDQGVDYAGTGYLSAIAQGYCSRWVPGGWGSYGNFLEYVIDQPGPLYHHSVYYAEGVQSMVHNGQRMYAGQHIATLIPGWHSGIEIGWSGDSSTLGTWARLYGGGYNEGYATRGGIAFSNLVRHLGGPGGVIEGPVMGNWPSWMPNGNVPSGVNPGLQSSPGGGAGQPFFYINPMAFAGTYSWYRDYLDGWKRFQLGADAGGKWAVDARRFARSKTYLIARR